MLNLDVDHIVGLYAKYPHIKPIRRKYMDVDNDGNINGLCPLSMVCYDRDPGPCGIYELSVRIVEARNEDGDLLMFVSGVDGDGFFYRSISEYRNKGRAVALALNLG